MSEPGLAYKSLRDVRHVLRQEGRRRNVSGHAFGFAEIVQVVALGPAERQCHRKGLPSTTRTTHSLLIVEALRRHVRLEHYLQRPNIDPYLHGRCHGEEVDPR